MSETGRFYVITRSGRRFCVEPMGGHKADWGNVNPATGKLEQVHAKSRGTVAKEESVISAENGFRNIAMLGSGVSPLGVIAMLDDSGVDRIEMDGVAYES